MRRLGPGIPIVAAVLLGVLLLGVKPMPAAQAADPLNRSNVILVMDFSASILQDQTNRNRFGAALERIADRVDETSSDLTSGSATLSIIQFATSAADLPGCVDLKTLDSAETVGKFADCLRSVAAAYRKGPSSSLSKSIGIDTNYVAAMERANEHLPRNAARPTVVLFTDGKHDVDGVPVSQVLPTRDRLFGARSPFALLPVGMGLQASGRDALAAGLASLKVIRDMPACTTGASFVWPTEVFDSADEAGNAVAVALQDSTCTFTAAPTPVPTKAPALGAVQNIRLTAGDGRIEIAWAASTATTPAVIDYAARCRADDGDAEDAWIESKEGVSLTPEATIDGLANGTSYRCEVAAIGPDGPGAWTPAGAAVTPVGRPSAPGKPSVSPKDRAVNVEVQPAGGGAVVSYRFECSGDNGATWPAGVDVPAGNSAAVVGNLSNGVDYLCRAFAANASGVSDASVLSDAVKPCGSALECNPILIPAVGGVMLMLALGVIAAYFALFGGRPKGYVVAVVDIVYTANIGHGSSLGIAFVRAPDTGTVTGIVAERGPTADIRIRRLRDGRFRVRDRSARRTVPDGEPIVVADSHGGRHSLMLQSFDTNPASQVASRR